MIRKVILLLGVLHLILLTPVITNAQVIHEVQNGDSLYKISRQYNKNLDEIAKLNGLSKENRLVIGQSLLLPGSTYIVQPGDNLWKIAHRHAMKKEAVMAHNQLKNEVIIPGQKLQILRSAKTTIWTGKYFTPKDKKYNEWILNVNKNVLSSVFMFDYHPDYNGNLSQLQLNHANTIAWNKNIPPYATISNLSAEGFDPKLTHHLISNAEVRKRFIKNIHALLHNNEYKGVIIDFERVYPRDRSDFGEFMKELAENLHPSGMKIMIAVPPMQGDQSPSYSAGYNYKTIGKYVDTMFLMTYDWHWPGGPSGPIAPINKVRETLNYAVSVVPPSKLMLGIPMYAYDWTISGKKKKGTAYAQQRAVNLYISHQSQVHYDEKAASPWFRYVDEQGMQHEVWFEDPRSLLAKFRLVKEYRLAGLGCWHLGLVMPQTEELLTEEFNLR